jgi:hypothetical protein
MHLSLKGSMDRQPLTDRLGDRLLAEYGGASAAYSLRALNGNGDSVVRVRRASDNDEEDFTALQVSSGELTNWVNSQIVPPLDIGVETSEGRIPVPEGGTSIGIPAAAYSLRNLSTTYTGNVVDVRRSSGGTDSFTAAEVADGTLETWVLAPVSSFIGNKMYFNGATSVEFSPFTMDSTENYIFDFSVIVNNVTKGGFIRDTNGNDGIKLNGVTQLQVWFSGNFAAMSLAARNIVEGVVLNLRLQNDSGTLKLIDRDDDFLMGSVAHPVGVINAYRFGNSRSNTFLDGLMFDTSFDADGSGSLTYEWDGTIDNLPAGWTVNGSPELFTGQGVDGFVSQWYDQSGNDNHATQGTAASQPKIVDGGSLVSGGLDFDGVDDFLQATDPLDGATSHTSISVINASQAGRIMSLKEDGRSDENWRMLISVANDVVYGLDDGTAYSAQTAITLGNNALIFGSYNSSDLKISLNGGAPVTLSVSGFTLNTTGALNIGRNAETGDNDYGGTIQEIIIYTSDQSDNRTAIEANIGETYGITGIPAYDNTVDGFVETWYDQSGNGNDATQSVAASQPKIVDGGTLATKLGQPSINFTTDSAVLLSDSFSITETESAVFAIWQPAQDSATTVQSRHRTLFGNASSEIYIGTPNADSQMSFKRFGAVKTFTLGLASLNTPNLHAFVGTTAGVDYYFNGSSIYSDTATGTNSIRNHLRIGSKQNLATHDTEGYISELIIYDSDQSANRSGIETNINDHYNIY